MVKNDLNYEQFLKTCFLVGENTKENSSPKYFRTFLLKLARYQNYENDEEAKENMNLFKKSFLEHVGEENNNFNYLKRTLLNHGIIHSISNLADMRSKIYKISPELMDSDLLNDYLTPVICLEYLISKYKLETLLSKNRV